MRCGNHGCACRAGRPTTGRWLALPFLLIAVGVAAQTALRLEGTDPLSGPGDLSPQMVEGIDRFLMRELDESIEHRARHWQRDFSSRQAYEKSVDPNRERLRRILGAVDLRYAVTALDLQSTTAESATLLETERYTIYAVRWPVFDHVYGEGLLLEPKTSPLARVVAIPDADQTPEMLVGLVPGVPPAAQFARRLAENGCQLVVPVLINRHDTWSGNPILGRFTNQPHREWIYRQAYQMGRHIIGYEIQKVFGLLDWFEAQNQEPGARELRIGAVGYGEGGLLAFYSAAQDKRIDAALVSGYFGPRERVWEEPIYRNVFGLLDEFGDAEIASLIAPRPLIVEYSEVPKVSGPPQPGDDRRGAAPGELITPERYRVQAEVDRARNWFPAAFDSNLTFVYGNEGQPTGPGSDQALSDFIRALDISRDILASGPAPRLGDRSVPDAEERQRRQVTELVDHTQHLLRLSDQVRDEFFWDKLAATPTNEWAQATESLRTYFWEEIIGRFPSASIPVNARSRVIDDRPRWNGYEVVLDVWPDVFAWGYLLLPNDIKPGERRPVVVCQHGLEGLPIETINGPNHDGFRAYRAFAARLADRGFVVFAPHNPYRGGDQFRVLQRKANPLKKSLFSVIIAQHDRILDWLCEQPYVDPDRIGFYGLSYGGKTAMRVPAVLDRYALSICSADFNDWIRKNVTVDSPYSYLFTNEYEMPEFNLGPTFNYAEMAALIAPRPFMVERGHRDGVAPDEWVAYEYAKVRRLYTRLGIADHTSIEFFDGPHTIHGVGTFQFLYRQLEWTRW
jgi:dienelactone hydrolase